MKFRDYFNNDFATQEMHYLPSLRTRYYRCRTEEAMEAVKRISKKWDAKIRYIDDARHEIIFDTRNFSATATIVSPMMTETAVDWNVSTSKILPLGKGKKIIEELYKQLDSILQFKAVSLYHSR